MTADYTYGTYAVYDPTTNSEVDNGTGGKFVLVVNGAAQPIFDLLGNPITEITSNALGQSSQFRANTPNGLIQFGTTAVTVFANEVGAMAVAAYNAISGLSGILSLEDIQDAVNAMVVAGTGIAKVYDDTAGSLTLSTPAALLSAVTQAFTGPTNFGSATASVFTTTPKVGANDIVHAGNIAAILASSAVQIAYHNASTQPYFIRATSAGWPNSGARVTPDGTSLSTLTSQLTWESTVNAGLAKPTGFIDGDIWWERVS